jgi:heme A synthase
MRNVYRALAYLIALAVVVQAAAIAYGVFGLAKWVDGGGVLDRAAFESEGFTFPGLGGLMLHGMNGMFVIPVISLLFLILSFFAKIPGGVKWAAFVFLAVIVQVALGIFAHGVAPLGILHGINALILFSLAVMAGVRAGRTTAAPARRHAEATAAV